MGLGLVVSTGPMGRGTCGSVRALRRCGSGVAVVALGESGKVEFAWGAFVPLHGEFQTAPRAELNACITVLAKVSCGGSVELVTDSLLNYHIFERGRWWALSPPITTCGLSFGAMPRGSVSTMSR